MFVLNELIRLLAQTEFEKNLTVLGVALIAGFFLILIIDALTKNKFVPKNKSMKGFIIFLFIIAIIVLILLFIFYI